MMGLHPGSPNKCLRPIIVENNVPKFPDEIEGGWILLLRYFNDSAEQRSLC